MSLSKIIQQATLQTFGGIAIGTVTDNLFATSTLANKDAPTDSFRVGVETILQVGVSSLLAALFFETTNRLNFAEDVSKGFAFYITMFGTQPRLAQKLQYLSHNVTDWENTFQRRIVGADKTREVVARKPWAVIP